MRASDILLVAGGIANKIDFGSDMLQRIAEIETRSGMRLSLPQKVLLAETGTVEQVLSVLTNSSIKVKVVEQRENTKTITRQAVIMNDGGKVLIKALTKVYKRNLPTKVVSKIRSKETGIGTIITNSGIETFRRIVELGYHPKSRSIFRKYKIICRKKVAFEIKEEFVGIQ